MINFQKNIKKIEQTKLVALYHDVGWAAYTKDEKALSKAIENSLDVYTAWDKEKLVGLLRTVGDDMMILYIQDILVLRSYQNQGIGSQLLKLVLAKDNPVRQNVLLTDRTPELRAFYEKNGFQSCDTGDTLAFAKFN